jgi:hypothetical protein
VFKKEISKPIDHGRSTLATAEELESGEAQRAVLQRITNNCLLARRKDMLQGRYALKG